MKKPWHLQVQCPRSSQRVASPTHAPCAIPKGGMLLPFTRVFGAFVESATPLGGRARRGTTPSGLRIEGLAFEKLHFYVVRRVTRSSGLRGWDARESRVLERGQLHGVLSGAGRGVLLSAATWLPLCTPRPSGPDVRVQVERAPVKRAPGVPPFQAQYWRPRRQIHYIPAAILRGMRLSVIAYEVVVSPRSRPSGSDVQVTVWRAPENSSVPGLILGTREAAS